MKKFLIILSLVLSFLNAMSINDFMNNMINSRKSKLISYQIECLNGNEFECFLIGMVYLKNDIFLANRYFKKSCKENTKFSMGCQNLAITFLNDKLYNPKKAIQYFKKACIRNNEATSLSCTILGEIFYDTKLNDKKVLDQPDYNKAVFYSRKGCDLNDSNACWNLQYFYYNGIGVQKNRKLSDKYLKKSCKLKFRDGCETILNKEEK